MIPGPTELLIILVIVIVIFGAKRIPEIMGGIGKGIKTFKRAMEDDEPHQAAPSAPAAPTAQAPQAPPASAEVQKEKPEAK